ncbi:MAG: sulfatase-like hydrolase/transferase [Candidatus Latescibacteria bacterium]|jgi:arylsulfatase A-like enzyme|nr:sulfatase-like hydrolase/transferase [Candidatus Latescibacterota bacterium]
MSGTRPNLIFILCDQLRFDCLGYAGHSLVETPNIDRLAERGVAFETAYCASPVCSPARASWLTGTYPHAHQQLANYGPERLVPEAMAVMRPDAVTLGDVFKEAGYWCGIAGPWHLGHDHQPQHGFEEFWRVYRYQGDHPDILFDYFDREGVPNLYEGKHPTILRHGMDYTPIADPRQQRTTWTINQGLEFLDTLDDRSFFLYLSVKDPHPLIAVSQELIDKYPIDKIDLPKTWKDDLAGRPDYLKNDVGRMSQDMDETGFRTMMAYYFALITHIDDQVGRLMDHLESLGLADNTIVTFISDHGEMLGEHHAIQKRMFWEASVRVPCVVSWPAGLPSGHLVTTPLGGVDLAPTLLELCGLSFENSIDGRSVAQAIREGEQSDCVPIFSEIGTSDGINFRSTEPEELAARVMVRDGDWKYIMNRTDDDELYNVSVDPLELTNLAADADQADRITHGQSLIREMITHTGPGYYAWCLDA